jgi:D-amino-acid dehydrogenase
MRILVLGAGIAGVTAAWQLLDDGHEVTVVERQAEAASETTFANAGLIAPGHAFAWASPKAAKILLKSLLYKDQPLRFKSRPEPALWRWSLQFLAQCTSARARRNTQIKHRLCRYAQQALQELSDRTGIGYHRERRGVLYLHRSQASLDRGIANMAILREAGQELEVVDRARAVALDPALAPSRDKIAGGIYSPGDESGDACKFTRALAGLCAGRGASFCYRTTVRAIEASGARIERVLTDQGELRADLYLLACGSYSPLLTRALGERLSVYPIKGYSVTFPVDGANNPPTIGGVDEDNLCAYARLGDRVRSTAVAEFAGYDTSHAPADFRGMLRALQDLFPSGADYRRPQYWACLRPMTPEGTPVLGRGRFANLYYNTGHGHMGWTMACGTARIVADLIAGRTPDLPLEGLLPR